MLFDLRFYLFVKKLHLLICLAGVQYIPAVVVGSQP